MLLTEVDFKWLMAGQGWWIDLRRLNGTAPGDIPVIREMFAQSLADDGLGMKTRRKDDKILLSYPIAILAADI